MPESSSSGTTMALSSGPSASSLFTSSAMAYDAADVATATTATSTSATTIAERRRAQPEEHRHEREQDALHDEHDDVAHRPARAAARCGSPA